MKAYKNLVNFAIKNKCNVSVFDGEEWQVNRSTNKKEIYEAIDSVEESQLEIRTIDGDKKMGWALVIDQGDTPDDDMESIADYTMTEFMQAWALQYY